MFSSTIHKRLLTGVPIPHIISAVANVLKKGDGVYK
jgi:hypothetical protein